MTDRPPYTNRLIRQKSPYLLQHAHNPVDWYPWGEEAFEAAKSSDRPIFLSIGYATCHWCHVMERESFENVQIAQLLNENFICIKVDREELPEVDGLYMEFAQGMMSGAAGWPLNVILTPALQPFFAATYLPPNNQHGMMGLIDLVARIKEVWGTEERESVVMQAEQVVQVFANAVHAKGDEIPDKDQLQDISDLLFKLADPVYGGMKGSPKFPISYQYNFLLRYAGKHNDSRALFFIERTLDMMHRGGIYDHLGGGFSRYSVDEEWLIPHFEKMLYDNALIAFTYLETWQVTKDEKYRTISESVLNYVIREMRHSEGGFYSAEDADSDGHEGLFYTWTPDEIEELLGRAQGELFCDFYGVLPEGNFEGRNVLHTKVNVEEFALNRGLNPQEFAKQLEKNRKTLFKAREKRPHPFKDDKILSSWNGLMIFAMAEAGAAFGEKRYIDAAVEAATFIKENMWQEDQLFRRWREADVGFNAGLDEYAFLIRGALSLFEVGCGSQWLTWAMEMTEILQDKFKAEEGAFYQTDGMDDSIILRKCQFSDGAEPSGNAIHCENLMRLYQLTLEQTYFDQASDVLKGVKKYIDSYAPGYCYHMMNLNRYYEQNVPTFVIALNDKEEYRDALLKVIYSEFIPHRAVIWRHEEDKKLFRFLPFVKEQGPIENKTTLYLCHEGACQKPLTDFNQMVEAIKKTSM
ncbi:MAG: thioredoxin domain-containing protein [Parachlamydiaceae bacterium]|nr:thioredoxin domain-containing protein [Parachlamydiaceae bacterium]